MKQSWKRLSLTTLVLTVLITFSGCVGKTYVQQQLDAQRPAIKEAINASKETAERIDAVDKRVQDATTAAQTADQKATQAGATAQAAQQTAQSADSKGDAANQGLQQAGSRISTIESRIANLGDNYTPSQKESVRFAFNSAILTKDAQVMLDKFAETASGLKGGYTVEVQGFTDSTGGEAYNILLSQRRADTVQRYLLRKGVPLYRISMLGLGKEGPVADNKTKKGRDQNRRVEVTLLKLA
jgi:outer membrane protein OmpA-like peptidoglycan-associated protein